MGGVWRISVALLAAAVFCVAGCGPCRCLDGTRFANRTSCEECFQGCSGIGSFPTGCRIDTAAGSLTPVPDPTFTPNL